MAGAVRDRLVMRRSQPGRSQPRVQPRRWRPCGGGAGRGREGRAAGKGQGFQLDQEMKVAVEALAMNLAAEFYSKDGDVEDVHGRESYDLICRRGDEVKHVEVKGTTTNGAEVILTPNEVRHARQYPCSALFVVSNIAILRAENGTVAATSGNHHCYDLWRVADGTLTPLGLRYQVPPTPTEDARTPR